MSVINPDLVFKNEVQSRERRAEETDVEYAERLQEYDAAYAMFDQAVEDLECQQACEQRTEQLMREADQKSASQNDDTKNMTILEQQFSS